MTKAFLCVALVCLLGSSHALLPLGEILEGVTGAVTGLTGTLSDVLNETVPQLTKIVQDLVKTLVEVVKQVLELLLKLLQAVVDALQQALKAPLQALLGIVDSLTKGLLPSSLADALKSALKLDDVTALVKQLTGTVTCLLDKVVTNLTSEVLKGVVDILKCANPLVKEVGNITNAVEVLVKDTLDVTKDIVDNILKCVSAMKGPDVLSDTISCLVVYLGKGVQELSKIIAKTTPKIQQALDVAVKALQCIQNVIIDKLNKAGAILKTVADCASGKLPQLPGNIPNFTDIAKKVLNEINNAALAAIGPSSPLNCLVDELDKLKAAAEAVSSSSVAAAVNSIVKDIKKQIDAVKAEVAGGSTCVTEAESALKQLAVKSAAAIEADAAKIAPEAAKLISQSITLDFELKNEIVEASPKALKACAQYASATDNSAQQCFDLTLKDAEMRIDGKLDDVEAALDTAQGLTEKTMNVLSSGTQKAVKEGEAIIAKLKACLM